MALAANENTVSDNSNDGMEIFLQSGDLYFGNAPTQVSTMLHSRTAISFWHPATRIGGMCHVIKAEAPDGEQDIHYANNAIVEFSRLANKYNTPLNEYEVKVFGGVPKDEKDARQHEITLDTICKQIREQGFKLTQLHGFAGSSRKLKLDLATGVITSREIGADKQEKNEVERRRAMAEQAMEIFLHPGEIYFGKAPMIISTLLGSCVAATLWHPDKHLGGMCHIVLPESNGKQCEMKYGDCAIGEFVKQISRHTTDAKEYVVNIYGGSDMFPDMQKSSGMKIGDRNIDKVRELLELYKFRINEVDTGGSHSRKIRLDLSDGSVGIRKHGKPAEG